MFLRTSVLALAALALTATGCDFEEFDGPYDGEPVMEFNQLTGPAGPYGVAVSEGSGTLSLRTNLIGPQMGSATTLSFSVVDGTTAVEGTHYALPNGTDYTLPANSSFASIDIEILDGSLDEGESRVLRLELEGASDGSIGAAENFDDFTVTIVGD